MKDLKLVNFHGAKVAEETALSLKHAKESQIKWVNGIGDVKEFNELEKWDISWITTSAVDHAGDVVLPEGIDRTLYLKNPVVLWAHNDQIPAIGNCQWIKPFQKGLQSKTVYAKSQMAQDIFALVKDKVLRAKSIGFFVVDSRSPTREELKTNPTWKGCRCINKSMLLEYSLVNIPCNAEALVESVSKGLTESQKSILGILPVKITQHPKLKIDTTRIAERVLERLTGKLS